MNKKIFKGVVKSFDEKTHTATIFISTGDIDRDLEVIEPKSFQKSLGNYLAHPILLSSHRAEVLTRQIGEAKAIRITDQGVEGDYEWYAGKGNPEADWGWFLVTRGIAAFSIGFIPKVWLDKWSTPIISQEDSVRGIVRRYTEIELLENSQVLVPANPNALQRRLDEAQGAEKEVLELAVKELKENETKPFSDAEAAKEKALHEKSVADFKAMLSDPSIHEEIIKILKEEILKQTGIQKHYSEVLLGAGSKEAIRTSTEEKMNGAKGENKKTLTSDDLLGAVRAGVQEGIK